MTHSARTSTPYVSLHVWRVPRGRLLAVLWRMARDRGRLRRTPGVRFAKLLGTGQGRWFGPTRADPTRWAALVVADQPGGLDRSGVAGSWQRLAVSSCHLALAPISSRGSWAGHEPFRTGWAPAADWPDPTVLALTRARLRLRRAVRFWRAIAPVGAAATAAPGLLATFGIGEAPIGWQGTVSVWRNRQNLVEFAYRHPEHRSAIERTPAQGWYAEELFARFAVLDVTGDRSLIGWAEEGTA